MTQPERDFVNLDLHFRTPIAFASWLASQPRPAWPDAIAGSTYHNTYIPNESTWRGHDSMASMATVYADRGWSTGPHVYLAVGTANPANDGIWIMAPPWQPGVHAFKVCNATRFGIELVGDFHKRPIPAALRDLLVEVAAILHRYAEIGPQINDHRDCAALVGISRTCPGDAAHAQQSEIQRLLAAALAPQLPISYTEHSPIMGRPRATDQQVLARFPAPAGEYTARDILTVILPTYWSQSLDIGLDPILAIAQMAHETKALTSFWSQRPQRNPAGIGVNGRWQLRPPEDTTGWAYNTDRQRWEMGVSFPYWVEDSIPAHVGRLLAYALSKGAETPAQRRAIEKALSYRPLPDVMRGSAPILKLLGQVHNPTGQGWAKPGTSYGKAIAAYANRLAGL